MTVPNKILMIDNHDSFTYNIVQYLQALEQDVVVWQNDAFTIADVQRLKPKAIIIGPGPCRPNDAGMSLAVIDAFKEAIPIFGICLGHQAIGQAFGGRIMQAGEIMHGRLSNVYHRGQGVFVDLANPCQVTRYHSLVIDKASLPHCLEVTAWTQRSMSPLPVQGSLTLSTSTTDNLTSGHSTTDSNEQMEEIMAIRHRYLPIEGVQFHPESILSTSGYQLLNNFLQLHGLAVLSNDNLPCVG